MVLALRVFTFFLSLVMGRMGRRYRQFRTTQADIPGIRNWLLIAIPLQAPRDMEFFKPFMRATVFFKKDDTQFNS